MVRAASLLVLSLAACAGSPKVATGVDDIAALRARWLGAFNAKQLDVIAATYAVDAVYVPITGNRVVSGLAIKNLYERIWTRFAPHMTLEPHVVERRGDLAYESGDYHESIGATEGALEIDGAYAAVYRHDADGWKLVTQVWTERTAPRTTGE